MVSSVGITEQDIPVLSTVSTRALNLLQNEATTNQQIKLVVSQDPALTARILQIANTPFYLTTAQSQSIDGAIRRLGMHQLRKVILAAATGEIFDQSDPYVQFLWKHMLMSAIIADKLAGMFKPKFGEDAYVAGLLHDLGKLILYHKSPEFYGELIDEARQVGRPVHELEAEQLARFNHVTVGTTAVRAWNLGDPIIEATRHHQELEHEVSISLKRKKLVELVSLVSLASIFANNLGFGIRAHEDARLGELTCVKCLELSQDQVLALYHKFEQLFQSNGEEPE